MGEFILPHILTPLEGLVMEPLNLENESLELIEESFKMAGKTYILKEAPESLAARYQNAQMQAMKVIETQDGNKTANVNNISDTEALLVSFCLFEVLESGSQKTVEISVIKSWPHRIVKPIFDRAEFISGLKPKETEQVLVKRLKDTQDKLAKLRASKGEDVQLKN